MKFLIWFLCLVAYSVLTTMVTADGHSLGFMGTLILFGAFSGLAGFLCAKLDRKKEAKQAAIDAERAKDPAVIRASIPSLTRKTAEQFKDDPERLRSYLDGCVKDKKITDIQKDMLLEEYLPID